MDFSSIPGWVADVGASGVVVLAMVILYLMLNKGILPLMREMGQAREELWKARQTFYETTVIPTMKGLTADLTTSLETQRKHYEGRLDLVEKEHAAERAKLVKQIEDMTTIIVELQARVDALEAANKTKDSEIAQLKSDLQTAIAQRDALQARLDALDKEKEVNEKAA